MSLSPDARAERIRARGEQERLSAAAQLDLERGRLALKRQKQIAKEQARRERQHTRRQRQAALAAKIRIAISTIGRRAMIVVPITAPMSVAWTGQIDFARNTLHWPLWAAVLFAASWELTTAFAGWMYHQARTDGDRGTLFRIATWLFASSAGAMNYWHACPPTAHGVNLYPTPKAVSYGAMSIVGIALWELYASLIHRKQLRAAGLVSKPRPRFGMARWLRYPHLTFTAWSLSIRDGISTVDVAWHAAVNKGATSKAIKRGRELNGVDEKAAEKALAFLKARKYRAGFARVRENLPFLTRHPDQIGAVNPNGVLASDHSRADQPDRSDGRSQTQFGRDVQTIPEYQPQTQVPDHQHVAASERSETTPSAEASGRTKKVRAKARKQTKTGKQSEARSDDRLDEARAADAAYLAEHGRHISAEKLARALHIAKPAALELVKKIRGAHMDVAK